MAPDDAWSPPADPVSLFDSSVTNATDGVVWLASLGQPTEGGSPTNRINVASNSPSSLVASEQIDSGYVDSYALLMWVAINFRTSGGTRSFNFRGTSPERGDAAGPQFTDAAETNLVLAFQLDDDSTLAYDFSELVASDSTEPYSILRRFRDRSRADQ